MRLLLDSCVWGGVREPLLLAGYDVVWVPDEGPDPSDEEVLAHPYREQRVLVSLDKDFGELAIFRNLPHCGIVRLVDLSVTQQAAAIAASVEKYGEDLATGGILTVELKRVRLRPGGNP